MGALVVLMAVQVFVLGLYLAPVFNNAFSSDSTPDDHFSASPHCRGIGSGEGALVVLVAVQLFVLGLYLPPVLRSVPGALPPQTIISLPVHTAV